MKISIKPDHSRVFYIGYRCGISGKGCIIKPLEDDILMKDWIRGWREGHQHFELLKREHAFHPEPA